MRKTNATATVEVWPIGGHKPKRNTHRAWVTAKQIATPSRTYDKASGKQVSKRYPFQIQIMLVDCVLDSGVVVFDRAAQKWATTRTALSTA